MIPRLTRFAAICALMVTLARAAAAQDAVLDSVLRANSHPFDIKEDRIAGSGERLLLASLDSVQFVAMGEMHNRRAMHTFGTALFRMLHERAGFNYFALEEDPYLGQLASRVARAGGRDSMLALAKQYPNAFHLVTETELDMLADIGRMSKARSQSIWGLNQVFGATHYFDRLIQLAPNATAADVARKLRDHALEYERERFMQNKHYMAAIVTADELKQLHDAFKPRAGSEAAFLIDQLRLSQWIFAPYTTTPRPPSARFFESGIARETNMKHLFAQRYSEALKAGDSLPRVMAFFGHLHLGRGMSQNTDLFTFGNYLHELAHFNKQKSLHVYAIGAPPRDRVGWAGPVVDAAGAMLGNADGVLIVLRPVARRYARSTEGLTADIRRLVFGFDFFVYLRDTELGGLERLRTPRFRHYPD